MVKPARSPDLTLSLSSAPSVQIFRLQGPAARNQARHLLVNIACNRAFALENNSPDLITASLSATSAAHCASVFAAFQAPSPREGGESPVPSRCAFKAPRGDGCLDLRRLRRDYGCCRRCRRTSARATQSSSSGFPRANIRYLRQRSRAWAVSKRSYMSAR